MFGVHIDGPTVGYLSFSTLIQLASFYVALVDFADCSAQSPYAFVSAFFGLSLFRGFLLHDMFREIPLQCTGYATSSTALLQRAPLCVPLSFHL